MEIEQVAELARTVAWLPKAERDFFDGMVAEQSAMAADAERIAKLRKMSDVQVVRNVLSDCTQYATDHYEDAALKMLREAGFVRGSASLAHMRDAHCKLEGVLRIVVDAFFTPDAPGALEDADLHKLNNLILQAATSLSLVASEEFCP